MGNIRYVTIGGVAGTHNIYYDDWTYEINSRKPVAGYTITSLDAVITAYEEEHPEEQSEDEYM